MAKLTLSVDDSVVRQAKRYARARGTSVSRLVETYLDLLSEPGATGADPPVLRQLRGLLRSADLGDHRRHLRRKYR